MTSVRRVVFASSGGVLYGEVAEPADEEHPQCPISPYGISKLVGEHYLRFFVREHGLEGVALRYANVYGPRQNPHGEAGVVAIFCERMLAGMPTTIHGDGGCQRDYVFVTDVARANLLAMTLPLTDRFAAFNIGTGIATDVNQLAEQLLFLCQSVRRRIGIAGECPAPAHGTARPGDLRCNLLNCHKAAEELGWSPQIALTDGLSESVEWFAKRVAPRR